MRAVENIGNDCGNNSFVVVQVVEHSFAVILEGSLPMTLLDEVILRLCTFSLAACNVVVNFKRKLWCVVICMFCIRKFFESQGDFPVDIKLELPVDLFLEGAIERKGMGVGGIRVSDYPNVERRRRREVAGWREVSVWGGVMLDGYSSRGEVGKGFAVLEGGVLGWEHSESVGM